MGYVAYLYSSLKFNFQRAKQDEMGKISPFFYKVLEKSKIRTLYEGSVFNMIWNMMQPDPEARITFGRRYLQ